MRTRTWRWLAAGLVVAAATTACNGGGDPSAETTSSAPPTTTEPTTAPPPTVSDVGRRLLEDPDFAIFAPFTKDAPEQYAVLRAYVQAEQAWIKAGMAPVNPDHPDLLTTTTGDVLTKRQESVRDMRERGEAYQAPKLIRVTPRTIRPSGSTAEVVVCLTEQVPVYLVATGEVIDEQTFSRDNAATLELVNGRWLLTSHAAASDVRDGESGRGAQVAEGDDRPKVSANLDAERASVGISTEVRTPAAPATSTSGAGNYRPADCFYIPYGTSLTATGIPMLRYGDLRKWFKPGDKFGFQCHYLDDPESVWSGDYVLGDEPPAPVGARQAEAQAALNRWVEQGFPSPVVTGKPTLLDQRIARRPLDDTCSHAFQHATAGPTTATVTIAFDVTYSSTITGEVDVPVGPGSVTRTSQIPMQVKEIQAVGR